MKKIYFLFLLLASFGFNISAEAQNLQVHYDFGHNGNKFKDRESLTTTLEMFRSDKWGNTFFFVDMNYKSDEINLAYWEIAREFNIRKTPFNVHWEYNGGISKDFPIKDAYLAGLTYAWNAPDFSKGFTITPMYKHLTKTKNKASWQITSTWYWNFEKGLFTFSGFADCWNDRSFATGNAINVFLSEPQFWVNFNHMSGMDKNFNLSLGGEVEISRNFLHQDNTFYFIPTLGAKWTF